METVVKPITTQTTSKPAINIGLKSTTTIKIQTIEELKAQKNEAKVVENVTVEDVTIDKKLLNSNLVKTNWNIFAEQQQKEGKMNDYLMLRNRELQINEQECTIKSSLDNQVQVDRLNEIKLDLMAFLKKECNNNAIQIFVEVSTDKTPSRGKLYTDSDKFEFLAEKHPFLLEMKKKFGLDTDI